MAFDQPELRSGAISQRIRVGALGLAAVFLLVMLATAFLHMAGDGDMANAPAAATNATAPAEPLATLGVAPGNGPAARPAPSRTARPIVKTISPR